MEKVRDILLILMALAVIGFIGYAMISFFFGGAGFSLGNLENPAEPVTTPEEAVAYNNFREYRFSEVCVRDALGDDRFQRLKSGEQSLEQAEQEGLAGCLVPDLPVFEDIPQTGQRYGLEITDIACTQGRLELRIKNLEGTGRAVPGNELSIRLDAWQVECHGLPMALAPDESARCTITDFVTEEYHDLQIRAPALGIGVGMGFECPFWLYE